MSFGRWMERTESRRFQCMPGSFANGLKQPETLPMSIQV
jgi:hypothetical protein